MADLNVTSGMDFVSIFEDTPPEKLSLWDTKLKAIFILVVLLFIFIQHLKQASRLKFKSLQWAHRENGQSSKLGNKALELPGPPNVPFVGNFLPMITPGADKFAVMTDWSLQYGPAFKLSVFGVNFVLLNSPPMIQKLLSNSSYVNKPKFIYETAISPSIKDGLVSAESTIWNHHRKVISRSFTYKALQHHTSIFNHHSKNMVEKLLTNPEDYPDSALLLQHTFLEVIFHTIMDREMISREEIFKLHEQISTVKETTSKRIREPWLMIPPIWWFHPQRQKLQQCQVDGKAIVKNILDRYKLKQQEKADKKEVDVNEEGSKRFKCLMEELLDAGFTDKEVFDELGTMIVAGHETTSWSATFLLLRLALNPDHQESCRKEVDELFEKKISEEGESFELTMDDLSSLKYLERCVFENLRLSPIIPMFLRRIDTPLKLDENLVLEPGLTAAVSPWVLHRSPEVFPDPEKFDPDRFLPENCKSRHSHAFLPFSAGPRNCIGWKVALISLKLVSAWVLRHFQIETTQKWEDIKMQFTITLEPGSDINLSFKRRTDIPP